VGFLAWVFGEVAAAGVSVDLVATSETTTTLAIDRRANALDDAALEALGARLGARCRVTVHADCAAVNLVGRGARRSLAWLASCAPLLDAHPVWMVSQSANDLGISILVASSDAPALVERLHDALLSARAGDGRYGPSWRDLRRAAA
jgi:aspartokinase